MSLDLRGTLLLAVDVSLALATSSHILLHKRQPRSALLWIMWVWTLPIMGSLAYLYFGYNKVGRPPHRPVQAPVKGREPSFEALAAAVSGSELRRGNRVLPLSNGGEAYPAMLRAIAQARHCVDLQTYLFDLDGIGEAFLMALEAAAKRGVRVRVLIDGLAAWGARGTLRRRLKLAGGEARAYWRLDRLFGQPLLNLRNHRKLMLVDGSLAFTGGLNISQRYSKGPLARLRDLRWLARQRPALRDMHFRLHGPVCADLQDSFDTDWKHSGGREAARATPRRAWPPLPGEIGGVSARVLRSGPDEDLERIYELLLGALSQARHSVDLCTPYFIPDQALLASLRVLGYRGIRVRLFVPRECDHPFIGWAAQEYFHDLLDAGVEVYEVGAPFSHTKLTLVDGTWASFGSSNLDPRSFRLNFELNVGARSPALVRRLKAIVEGYRREAHRVDLAQLRRRRPWQRLRSALVNLAAPYL